MRKNEHIKKLTSLEKALNILELLLEKKREISLTEICKELKIHPTTAYRILNFLKSKGYVMKNFQTLNYQLGIKFVEFHYKGAGIVSLADLSMTYLRNLSRKTRETINLATLGGINVLYLATVKSSEFLKTEIEVGTTLPANCTSLGKCMLAFLSEEEFLSRYKNVKKLPILTTNSISSMNELKKELNKIRKQGYAIDIGGNQIEINCVGAPIFNKYNKVIASISITGPNSRFGREEIEKLKYVLIQTAKDITNKLSEQ